MAFGGQTITFLHHTVGGPTDDLGGQTITVTSVDAPGCRHRPLSFKEIVELDFDIATEYWKSTLPIGEFMSQNPAAYAATLAVQPMDAISVDGIEYQIVGGIRPHPDMNGNPFKATLISTRHIG